MLMITHTNPFQEFLLKVDENKWMKYEQDWKHIICQVDVSYE
jgi:hypothetical protein